MRKSKAVTENDDLRPEYDASVLKGGVRGKYLQRYRAGTNLPRPSDPKGGSVKEASRLKLTDAQKKVLAAVRQTEEPGYLGSKVEGRTLDALLQKRLIKRGKKEGELYRFMMTKVGLKHVPPT